MSYSRWSNSKWYTFWCVPDKGTQENRTNAIFEVCDVARFHAAELRKDIDACARKCVEKDGGTAEEMEELKTYMRDFLSDVDARYKRGPSDVA